MKNMSMVLVLLFSVVPESNCMKLFSSKKQQLFKAIKNEDLTKVEKLITKEPKLISSRDKHDFTPLHWAVNRYNESLVSLLLDKGANIEVQDDDGGTPLHWAVIYGKGSLVRLLLDKGANIEAQNKNCLTPLHMAVIGNNEYVVRLLLDRGANIEAQDEYGGTPLHWAVIEENESLVRLLLDKGANIEAQDMYGRTPLYRAVIRNYESLVRLLLDVGANIEAQNKDGLTPLHAAVLGNNEYVVRLLLDRGANIEAQDDAGATPLHTTVFFNRTSLVSLLLDKGANIEVLDKKGKTALDIANKEGHTKIAKMLKKHRARKRLEKIENSADNSLQKDFEKSLSEEDKSESGTQIYADIFEAVEANDLDACKRFLEDSSCLVEKAGEVPLHRACEQGYKDLCSLLLEKNSDVKEARKDGMTPLMLACKEGHEQVCSLLLEQKGIVKGSRDYVDGGTALYWAVKSKHVSICKLLLSKGFSAHVKAQGLSLLHVAVLERSTDLIDLLLEHQSDPNQKDKEGYTAFHQACILGYDSIVKKLLQKAENRGIDFNLGALNGKTALHCAVEKSHTDIVRQLLLYEAEPDIKDTVGKTPLMYAAEYRYEAICKLLKEALPIVTFNKQKRFLGSLVKGHKNLEELFGVSYDSVPFLAQGSTINDQKPETQTSLLSHPALYMLPKETVTDLGTILMDPAESVYGSQALSDDEGFIADDDGE